MNPRRYIITGSDGVRVGEIKATSAPRALAGFKRHIPQSLHRGLKAEQAKDAPKRKRT